MSITNVDSNFDSYDNNHLVHRYQPSPVAYNPPSRHYVHPDLSFVSASPVLQERFEGEGSLEEINTASSPDSSDNRLNQNEKNSDLSAIIQEYLEDSDSQQSHRQVCIFII